MIIVSVQNKAERTILFFQYDAYCVSYLCVCLQSNI